MASCHRELMMRCYRRVSQVSITIRPKNSVYITWRAYHHPLWPLLGLFVAVGQNLVLSGVPTMEGITVDFFVWNYVGVVHGHTFRLKSNAIVLMRYLVWSQPGMCIYISFGCPETPKKRSSSVEISDRFSCFSFWRFKFGYKRFNRPVERLTHKLYIICHYR